MFCGSWTGQCECPDVFISYKPDRGGVGIHKNKIFHQSGITA